MPMTQLKKTKEEYRIPLAEICDAMPDIICASPDDWGNEGLEPGDPWTF